ncbi:MAG: isoprenylcysteine carboxylmethyltransferase family protein [Parcubacteria group bacterium]|nr:isoprenylcysteine carboxylmethyltransferase family protein [Parcubacteria group bacterium]
MKEEPLEVDGRKPVPAVRPPYLFGWALAAGLIIDLLKPLPLFIAKWLGIVLGLPLVVCGVSLLFWAVRTFAKSEISPRFKPVGSIMTSGPFAFTRNPMYLSFTLIYLGIAFALNAFWPIFILLPVIAILHYGVILREEKYLKEKFGGEYQMYKTRVRRWF